LANEIQRQQGAVDMSTWITVNEAAIRTSRPPGTITKACNRHIRTNGKVGRERRLDPADVDKYGKKLDEKDEIRTRQSQLKEEEKLGLKHGWKCTSCKFRHPAGPRPLRCTECGKKDFEPRPALHLP